MPEEKDRESLPKNEIIQGDCLEVMKNLSDESVDSVVTDPPYGFAFMGKSWDEFEPKEYQEFCEKWGKEVFRVLKSGAWLLAFSGTRTYHRMVVGLEDAGFEIKDQIDWLYGSGFPKSTDISKFIDKKFLREKLTEKLGRKPTKEEFKEAWGEVEAKKIKKDGTSPTGFSPEKGWHDHNMKQEYEVKEKLTPEAQKWDGWGTALKPAHEPIVLAQKPRDGTYAENVLKWGCGGLNIDGCRIPHNEDLSVEREGNRKLDTRNQGWGFKAVSRGNEGRWPANVILDPKAGEMLDEQSGESKSSGGYSGHKGHNIGNWGYNIDNAEEKDPGFGDSGGASRFFYCAKAHKSERNAGLEDLEKGDRVDIMSTSEWQKDRGRNPDEYEGMENDIATLKPINLMRYLVRLVTPPDGTVLDPFAGSGTTGCACEIEGFNYILIEKRERFAKVIAPKRCEYWSNPENWEQLKNHNSLPDAEEKRERKEHKTLEKFGGKGD